MLLSASSIAQTKRISLDVKEQSFSDVINQIWISAQTIPADAKVAKRIKCPSDQAVLII